MTEGNISEVCGKCRLPIESGETNLRFYSLYRAHSEQRCLDLLTAALAAAEEERDRLREMFAAWPDPVEHPGRLEHEQGASPVLKQPVPSPDAAAHADIIERCAKVCMERARWLRSQRVPSYAEVELCAGLIRALSPPQEGAK